MKPSPSMSMGRHRTSARPLLPTGISRPLTKPPLPSPAFDDDAAGSAAEPIDLAVAVEVDHRLAAGGVGAAFDLGPLEGKHAGLAAVEPPFAAAVLEGHGQIDLAVLVGVVGEVNLGGRIVARRQREAPAAVVQRRQCPAAAMSAQEQVELAVAVEIDEMQAAQPPLGVLVVLLRHQVGDARFLRDVGEALAGGRPGDDQEGQRNEHQGAEHEQLSPSFDLSAHDSSGYCSLRALSHQKQGGRLPCRAQ